MRAGCNTSCSSPMAATRAAACCCSSVLMASRPGSSSTALMISKGRACCCAAHSSARKGPWLPLTPMSCRRRARSSRLSVAVVSGMMGSAASCPSTSSNRVLASGVPGSACACCRMAMMRPDVGACSARPWVLSAAARRWYLRTCWPTSTQGMLSCKASASWRGNGMVCSVGLG